MKKLTKEWVRKAEADLAVVKNILHVRPPLNDEICYHCQQAGEKYIKALLQELSITAPRTHNLLKLVDLLLPRAPTLRVLRRGARSLRKYAVDYRYPGFRATSRQTRLALLHVDQMRKEIRELLGLPALPPIEKGT